MKNSFVLFLLLIATLPSFSQVNLNAGLMAYYPFNGNANDASGNANNPSFNNATLASDRFGNPNSAYSFNGTDNYIQIPNSTSLNTSNQISICAWVKVEGFYGGICHGNNVVMKGDMDYQPGNYKIRFDDSYFTNSQNCFITNPDLAHEAFFGINSSPFSTTPFVQTDKWYSVVYTCDGTTANIYVDCKLVGSGPANGLTFTNGYDLFLGKLNSAQYPYWFNGTMDEIRIYNRALNDEEIKTYGDCATTTFSCTSWLATPSTPSFVDIGKLNVSGHFITVEAVINRTKPFVPGGNDNTEGDIVSKHDNPTDVNYLLRPNHAFITTTNGFFPTPDIADIQLNKTYHVAMVYDGDTLKFYRDGCLMSKIAATGDLYQNNWDTRIGYYQNQIWNTNFIGYINEVRIWNVARTQSQIQTYMNSSLPNPTTQPGLLAYYTFDNLINKQGNAAWNGTLGGSATINQANPSCNAIVNNCPVPPPACNIIITKNADTMVCTASPVQMFATGGTSYSWSPSNGLSNANLSNPVSTPSKTTKYYVLVSDATGCSKTDSVTINVKALPVISKSNDTSICINAHVPMLVSGGTIYLWSPSAGLSNPNYANPVATPLVTTKYYVTVTNAIGCLKKDSVHITVNNLPVIVKSKDAGICMNAQIKLVASGGASYVWSPVSGLSNADISNPVASPLISTKYYVTATSAAGCSQKDSVNITVNSLPIVSKSNDTTICKNTHAQLVAAGGLFYSWSPAASLINANISNPVANPASNTIYHVAVIDDNGCTGTASITVNIKPVPTITKSKDSLICGKNSIKLFATGGVSYTWSPVATLNNSISSSPVASPAATTMYHVRITDAQSCKYTDSVKISIRPPAVFAVSADQQICTKTNQQLSASGGDTYIWTPTNFLDNPNRNNPVASPDQTTTYSVTITESTCNESTILSTKLTVLPAPTVHIMKSNDITCTAPSAHLTALGAQDYSWTPGDGLSDANISNPVASPQHSTVYFVTGKDQNGCQDSDSISVSVNYDKNVFYGLPNSFTPNGDGLNDCFGVAHWGLVSELDFSIYNRFGQRVFYTHNASDCWDGTFQGKAQDASVFVYVVKAKTACGVISQKGTVTLLR